MVPSKSIALAAAALSLSLVAAGTNTSAVGTASTSMTAVEFEVLGIDAPKVTIADIGTFASTDTNAAENILGSGAPFARAGVLPVTIGGDAIGAIEATSDGDGSARGATINETLGALTAVVNPASVDAAASATDAIALAQLATAEIASVADVLGLDFTVNTAGIASQVTQSASSATQGLSVSGVNLTLGDLLPVDLLAQLPLGTILELLEVLPVDVSVDIDAILDAVTAASDAVGGAVGDIADAVATLEGAVAEAVAAQAAVDELVADLSDLDPVALLAKYAAACDDLLTVVDCVSGLLVDADAILAAALTTVEDGVAAVVELVNALGDALTDLVDALLAMDGIDLDAILEALAAGELIDIGAIDIGVVANATADLATTTATVGCNEVPVRVLGIDIATPSCRAPLESASSVVATITGALEGVLSVLPLPADLVPDVRFEMFTDLVESTSTDGTYNRATAGIVALRMGVDPLTLCPTCIVDGLLEDVLGLVDDLLATVEGSLPTGDVLDGLGLGDLADDVDGAVAGLPSLGDLGDLIQDLLDTLGLGTLAEEAVVPGFDLTVDPVSSASFATVAGAPATPTAAPPAAPTTPSDPSLPATGGGLALLGGLAFAGALAFRRRG